MLAIDKEMNKGAAGQETKNISKRIFWNTPW